MTTRMRWCSLVVWHIQQQQFKKIKCKKVGFILKRIPSNLKVLKSHLNWRRESIWFKFFFCCIKSLTNVNCIELCCTWLLWQNGVVRKVFRDILCEKNLLDDLKYIIMHGHIIVYTHSTLPNIFARLWLAGNKLANQNYITGLIMMQGNWLYVTYFYLCGCHHQPSFRNTSSNKRHGFS